MTKTLATLIDDIQAILGDAGGTYFSDALCTAAIRQALHAWNQRVPCYAAVTITAVTDQYEYELSDEDPDALEIIDVLRQGDDATADENVSLTFDEYWEDNRLFFRLRTPESSSRTLIVRYKLVNTINGLDSATESTLMDFDDNAIINGGAFFAIVTRAITRTETINLSKNQTGEYRAAAPLFYSAFTSHLALAARRRAPVSMPDERAWKDPWNTHTWEQKP